MEKNADRKDISFYIQIFHVYALLVMIIDSYKSYDSTMNFTLLKRLCNYPLFSRGFLSIISCI